MIGPRELAFDIFNVVLMFLIIIITLYPFWFTIVCSFSKVVAGNGITLWPKQFSTTAYSLLLDYDLIWITYRNTIVRCIVGTSLSVFFTAMTAYPLSKREMPFQGVLTNFILITMLFGGGLIPSYILVKDLHMLNTIWALVIPNMLGAYNIFIVRNFFRSIPSSLEESARIDGANWFYIWIRIVVPLAKPVIATIALWSLVGHWNAWFDALIYIRESTRTVVQVILRKITIENSSMDVNAIMAKMSNKDQSPGGETLEAAITVITIVPMLVIYPFLQKYFVKGIMVGSIKG
ncbi:MAG: carbohydrate ABC transporter permease [Bianqueaceae bacterium]